MSELVLRVSGLEKRYSETGPAALAGVAFDVTSGELQAGAQGVSSPVLGVPGVEASIGVVVLGKLDRDFVGPRVARAAVEVAKRLA